MKTKNQLPVSQKFYSELRSRIHHVLALTGRLSCELDVVDLLDRYLTSGDMPDNGTSSVIQLMLLLLKPEIDKAVDRSNRARERARLRRQAKEEQAAPEVAADENEPDAMPQVKPQAETLYSTEESGFAQAPQASIASKPHGGRYFYSRVLR